MKRLLILIFSTILFASSYAGEPRLSIWGAYSYGKDVSEVSKDSPTGFYFITGCYRRFCTDPQYRKSAISLGIDYRVVGGLYLGACLTSGGKFSELTNDNPMKYVEAEASYKTTYVLFNCRFEWLKLKSVRLYSRGGLGIGLTSKAKITADAIDDIEVLATRGPSEKMAWQFSPAGIEYRLLRFLGVFAEGGFGNQGNMLAGVRLYPI